jgi:pimeloyl-ACP methyl ester carboxylesterase
MFTVAIMSISRLLIMKDQLLGRLRPYPEEMTAVPAIARHTIRSEPNTLDGQFVRPIAGRVKAALLICHGIGETVAHWKAAQTLLAQDEVASLVFNYSGYGQSTGWASPHQCEADAIAAFTLLQQLVPSVPISLLGFSLGSGIATTIATRVDAHRLILCAAFTSLRKAACSVGVPRFLTCLVPAVWSSAELLSSSAIPVLILHGEADRLFPPQMARELASACSSPCELIVFPGLTHNEPIYRPQLSYWSLITSRL